LNPYASLTDSELLTLVGKRDKTALVDLYRRYSKLLYTLIKKIVGDADVAASLLEEVFLIIWKKTDSYLNQPENPYTWLVTLTRNRAVDSARRSRNSLSASQYYDANYEEKFIVPQLAVGIDPIDIDLAFKIKPTFEEALNKLTDAQKYVLHLAYYDGYTLDEIANKLNIPVETVRVKIKTAVYNLRENLLSE
jgi:RNA polymerase sigma-70 factor (ECF subfamily)